MSVQTRPRPGRILQTGKPTLAHIIAPKHGVEGAVLAMEARLNGTPVKALCGHVFVPSRDPRAVPSCAACDEIFYAKFGPTGEPTES